MVTFPLFLLLAAVAALLLKTKAIKGGALVLGLLLGLSLASTTFGPPILNALTQASSALISALTVAAGGGA